jgi:hypothetical protein
LGDFTAGPRTLALAAFAAVLGVFSAFVATALLALIALFTNLFFYQRLSRSPTSLCAPPSTAWRRPA